MPPGGVRCRTPAACADVSTLTIGRVAIVDDRNALHDAATAAKMSVWGRSWSGVKRSPWRLTPHWPERPALDARCSGNRAGGHREVDHRPGVPGPRPRGRCDHGLRPSAVPTAESAFPYAPVAQMLRRLHRDHSARLAAAVGPQAAAVISPLVPDLFGAFGPAPPVTAASPGLERSRLLSALSGVVESLTSDSSLVIVVEDLHWVDTSTLALLGVLLRGTPQTGLLVVATAREPAPSEQVRRWCAVERASARLSVLTVPPFTASGDLAALGRRGSGPVGDGPRGRGPPAVRGEPVPGAGASPGSDTVPCLTPSWNSSAPPWPRCRSRRSR